MEQEYEPKYYDQEEEARIRDFYKDFEQKAYNLLKK